MAEPGSDIFDLALACYHAPLDHRHRLGSDAPLPPGMTRLLRLANGSPEVLENAVRQTGASPDELREAARFLVQRLCFVRGASDHRILGLEPGATFERLKEHHRLLMRLFHPDRATGDKSWTDSLASRVNEARTALLHFPSSHATWGTRPSRPSSSVVRIARGQGARPASIHLSSRWPMAACSRIRFTMPRQWMPALVLSGIALVAGLMVWGIYETKPHAVVPVASIPEVLVARPVPSSPVDATDSSAISTLLIAPDWLSLGEDEGTIRPVLVPVTQTWWPVATVPDIRELTAQEPNELRDHYIYAHQRGDLDGVLALFAPNAHDRDGVRCNRICQEYGTLFRMAWIRRIELHDLRWRHGHESASTVGRHELWLRRRDNGTSVQMTGNVSFEVRKPGGQPSVMVIDDDWPEN